MDFPMVLRAMGPLDSIIQAAGRCNREARLVDKGRVVVFRPAEGKLPPGFYRTATGVTEALLNAFKGNNPERDGVPTEYFTELYQTINTDRDDVQGSRSRFDYPETSQRFRMIDDETEPVVVQYGSPRERARVRSLVEQLRAGTPAGRYVMRELQPYLVSMRTADADKYRSQGLIGEVTEGPGEWLGVYDSVRGLQP
jgi:CRISPR-associated endonuclease/helicase Cas3